MLGSEKIIAFVATTDPVRAKKFYGDTLGLRFVSEDPFAVVFDANGVMLRIALVKAFTAAPFTVLGWEVPDATRAVQGLAKSSVKFERFPGMTQDEDGVWSAPGGARVAWFKDPDGNVLSVSQH